MKRLLILTAITAGMAQQLHAQNTTYGGGNAPLSVDAGYVSDYSPDGTIVLADGSVILINNATYEHGNNLLQNSGSWTSTGSLDLFLSAGSNTISGTIAPSFFNVQFNIGAGNTMAITNAQGVDIAGTLQFNNGVTTTVRSTANTGALHFAAGAAYTGGATDAQHVNGYVSKTGNTAFTFPVGSGTDLRTLSITAPASATDQYSVAWIAGDPGTNGDPSNANALHPTNSVTAPITSVSTSGQWDWIPVSGTGAGLTITVSIPDLSATGVAAADLRLVGWNGTSWIDLSGSSNATGNTENSTLSGTIPAGITISALGIGSTSTPLPVHFSAFDAYADKCNVQLHWSTAMEINNDYFTVERSHDGRVFTAIATVQSMGNSSERKDYSYIDEHPTYGRNYYRIQQVDRDGKYTATSVEQVHVHCNGDEAIKVFPTVSNNTVQVVLPKRYEGATVTILTALGQKVNVPMEKTNGSYRINIAPLAAAMYIIHVQVGAESNTFKIIKDN
jgi:hypothetical protein